MEMKVAISLIVRKYTFALVPGQCAEPTARVTMGPKDNLHFVFAPVAQPVAQPAFM